jgi:hypothetical protein
VVAGGSGSPGPTGNNGTGTSATGATSMGFQAGGPGLWAMQAASGWVMVHNTPAAELHVLALQPVNVTFQPAGALQATSSGSAGSNVLSLAGNGIEGRILIIGTGQVATAAPGLQPPPGAGQTGATGTNATAAQPWTASLAQGAQLVFLLRPTGFMAGDFDAKVLALQQQDLAGEVLVMGLNQAHVLDLGARVQVVTATANQLSLQVTDHRQDLGLCPGFTGTTPGGNTGEGGTTTTGTGGNGTTGTEVNPCPGGYAIALQLAPGALSVANTQNLQVTVDGSRVTFAPGLSTVFSTSRGLRAGTGTSGTGSAVVGPPADNTTQPGTDETTPAGTPPGSGTGATARTDLVYYATQVGNVWHLVVALPPGDHSIALATAAAGPGTTAPPTTTPPPGTSPNQTGPGQATPGFEVVAALAILGAAAWALRRRDA